MAKEKAKEKKQNEKSWDTACKKSLPLGAVISEPGSTKANHTGSWRTFRPKIEGAKCTKCGNCWSFCPDNAIKQLEDRGFFIDYNYCKGCLICVKECPTKSISVEVEKK